MTEIFKRIAIILPVFNEEETIDKLLLTLEKNISLPITFVLVNDGSRDNSFHIIKAYKVQKRTTTKRLINLSRNFGHQQALMAGFAYVPNNCDLVAVMDADFQDSPADLPRLIAKLYEGYDCVYGIRSANSGNIVIDKLTRLFYLIQKNIVSIEIPQNAGTFCVFSRKMLDDIRRFSTEIEPYFPGIRAYVGFRQAGVPLRRNSRMHGKSKVGLKGLIKLSLSGILGFTALPMRLIFMFGFILTFLIFILGLILIIMKLWGVTKIPGITTTLLLILGGFGVQIMFMGIIGEYIGKLLCKLKIGQAG